MLIADTLAREVVDPVFGVPEAYFAPDAILATLAYAAQIYCDFSGYTDIAIGLALLLGFVFPQNFNSPYRATGLPGLLAPLAHDPVALPARLPLHPARRQPRQPPLHLPQPDDHDGARRPLARRRLDLRPLGRVPRGDAGHRARARRADRPPDPGWLRWLGTFAAVCFGWILFRSPDLDLFWTFLGRIVDPGPATLWTVPVLAMVVAVIGIQLLPPRPLERLQLRIERLRPVALAVALAIVILSSARRCPSQGVPPFIYFQF